jgi:two-component system, chemotaxis family, chemotaxis protein CheY
VNKSPVGEKVGHTMPNAAALKVLVVDDQASVRQMTRMALEKLGIRMIHEAVNGQEALATAVAQPIDLIISDFNMPEMDGVGLLRAVRGHLSIRKVPFILVTGRGDRELVVKAAQAGVNNYIVKPFDDATLRTKLEAVLGRLH